jgi:hypothetical protein
MGRALGFPVKVLPLIPLLFFLKENNLFQVHPRGIHRPQEIGGVLTQATPIESNGSYTYK